MGILKNTILLSIAAVVVTLSGCAKFPANVANVSSKQLVFTMRVRGRINPVDPAQPNVLRHYFVAIDVDNNTSGATNIGPLAAIYPPYGGTGWVTSQNAQQSVGLTSFIQYDATNPQGLLYGVLPGSYFLNRTQPQVPLNYEILSNGSELRFVVDLSQIATAATPVASMRLIDVNFITTNSLPNANEIVESRQIDGIGPTGQDFVTIDVTNDRTYSDDDIDAAGYTPTDPDLDIESWTITVQTVSAR